VKHGGLLAIAVVLSASVAGCGRDPGPTQPGDYEVRGHVKLTGYEVDAGSQFVGTRVIGDADGIPVELVYGNTVVARTTTVDGVYRFSGIGPGGYYARTVIWGPISSRTATLTVSSDNLAVNDTLRLVSVGDLRPVPNPFPRTTWVYFESDDTTAALQVLDIGGQAVTSLGATTVYPPRFRSAGWHGRDQAGQPVGAGMYWVTYESGPDVRAHLLFLENPAAPARGSLPPHSARAVRHRSRHATWR
jgi:hypothetical protein